MSIQKRLKVFTVLSLVLTYLLVVSIGCNLYLLRLVNEYELFIEEVVKLRQDTLEALGK